ncbi:MAG: CHAT domain-containing protein [Candidatus Promineifilaceae bacterium]
MEEFLANFIPVLHRTISESELRQLIDRYDVTLTVIQSLKQEVARLNLEDPQYALSLALDVRRLSLQMNVRAAAWGNWTLGNGYLFTEQKKLAIEHYERSAELFDRCDQPVEKAQMKIGYVGALAYLGRFEEAIEHSNQIEPVLHAALGTYPNSVSKWALLINNLGIAYHRIGRDEDALDAYNRALELLDEEDTIVHQARIRNNQARSLAFLNFFLEAQAAFQATEQAFVQTNNIADLARLYFNWGALLSRWQRYADAEEKFTVAADYLKNIPDAENVHGPQLLYRGLNGLAGNIQSVDQVADMLTSASQHFEQSGSQLELGVTWLGLAQLAMQQEQWEVAEDTIAAVLGVAEEISSDLLHWQAAFLRAQIASNQHNCDEANTQFQIAIDIIAQLGGQLRGDLFRAAHITNKLSVYNQFAQHLLGNGLFERAVSILENARARMLSDKLRSGLVPALQARAVSTTDLPLRKRLNEAVDLLTQAARRQRELQSAEKKSAEATRRRKKKIDYLYQKISKLLQDDSFVSPLLLGKIASTFDVVNGFDAKTALLFFYQTDGYFKVFILTRNGVLAHEKLASVGLVAQLGKQLHISLYSAMQLAQIDPTLQLRFLPKLQKNSDFILEQLFDLLIGPLTRWLKGMQHLILIPDGVLHNVPFHALKNSTRYLIEYCAISYAPSLTALHHCQQPIEPISQAPLLMGYSDDRLAFVHTEINQLGQLFTEPTVLLEKDATCEVFLTLAAQHAIIHLSSHAEFREDDVLLSGFKLQDGLLTLNDIMNTTLTAQLVTLSACDTGNGRVVGSDLISLAGGFMGAGARSLIVSQWLVEDSDATVRLMDSFYRAVLQGESRVKALQQAQIGLLRLGRSQPQFYGAYQHPVCWAPFMLLGNWHAL